MLFLKIYTSIKYTYNVYGSKRHVILPKDMAKNMPKNRVLAESEWRAMGVQQSRGWEHYAIHRCMKIFECAKKIKLFLF